MPQIIIYIYIYLCWLQHVCFFFVRNNGVIGQPNSGKPRYKREERYNVTHSAFLDAFSVLL